MANIIDGICFKNMVEYAVRNLNNHVRLVNQLNVFPVPDGDTGTNMVTTIHKGLMAVGDSIIDLPSVSKKFARSVVFEARGNSGVIVSQFLKGMAERFYDADVADGKLFIEALEKGVQYAYASVGTPVEGTMLTVVKDATAAVKAEFNGTQSVSQIIDSFISHAKHSLENTPELLQVLKDAGVVDSGGAGIVYLFEGMKKYLDGESLDNLEAPPVQSPPAVDYDAFNRDSTFRYGYCTELLLQLLNSRNHFDAEAFRAALSALGDSLVVSTEDDKVRVHIHTRYPEKVFAYCHQYGEFLSCKIENMTVQHTGMTSQILCSQNKNTGAFAIVTVAHDPYLQKLFLDMGADVSICCEENISTQVFLDAFAMSPCRNIFVFPNSSDRILSAMQAKKLCQSAKVTVINSRSVAECYAALPTVDFEQRDIEMASDAIAEIINNLYVVSVAQRDETIHYGRQDIDRNAYYSFSGKALIAISKTLEETAVQTIRSVVEQQGKEIVTIFYRPHLGRERIDALITSLTDSDICAEFFSVPTDSIPCELTISFE